MNYALVTGASSGMGWCYAQQLAARGYNLLIVSNEEAIHDKAALLRKDYPSIDVRSLVSDLSRQDAAKELHTYAQEQQLVIEVLVNNAGVYHDRDFLNDSEGFNSLILMLHVYTPAMLCYFFGQDMAARHKGYILNVCSITAKINAQRLAAYGATKAFLTAFTRSLHIELREKGVYVTNIQPGAVDTGLYNIGSGITRLGKMVGFIVSPEYLVKRALNGLFKGRAKVSVPYVWNIILLGLIALLPTCALRLIRKLKWF